jgi:hypothetical protein
MSTNGVSPLLNQASDPVRFAAIVGERPDIHRKLIVNVHSVRRRSDRGPRMPTALWIVSDAVGGLRGDRHSRMGARFVPKSSPGDALHRGGPAMNPNHWRDADPDHHQ